MICPSLTLTRPCVHRNLNSQLIWHEVTELSHCIVTTWLTMNCPCSLSQPSSHQSRPAVIAHGHIVWNMTWRDVIVFDLQWPWPCQCWPCRHPWCWCHCIDTWLSPSPPLNNIRVMVILWRLRGNIIKTVLCWIVWHNVHSPQHTYMSSSYRSNRLGLSHWDPYVVHRGGCLELYYCNMVEWFWWDSRLMFDDQLVSLSALTLLVWSSGL